MQQYKLLAQEFGIAVVNVEFVGVHPASKDEMLNWYAAMLLVRACGLRA